MLACSYNITLPELFCSHLMQKACGAEWLALCMKLMTSLRQVQHCFVQATKIWILLLIFLLCYIAKIQRRWGEIFLFLLLFQCDIFSLTLSLPPLFQFNDLVPVLVLEILSILPLSFPLPLPYPPHPSPNFLWATDVINPPFSLPPMTFLPQGAVVLPLRPWISAGLLHGQRGDLPGSPLPLSSPTHHRCSWATRG